MSGGYVGVDVFYVISGFLITSQLVSELTRTGSIQLTKFYARRIRRLLPALAIVILTTVILTMLLLTPIDNQASILKSAIATSLFSSNIYFWKTTGSYFDTGTDLLPLLHMWSLSIEEQWYMILPGALLMAGHFGCSAREDLRAERIKNCAAILIVAVFLLSFALNIVITPKYTRAAYFLLPTRAWQFACGAIIAVYSPDRHFRSLTASSACSLAGIVSILLSVIFFSSSTLFPGWAAALPTLGTVLVIASHNQLTFVSAALSSRMMRYFGKLSYSWYLWHWPFLTFGRILAFGQRDIVRDCLLGLGSLIAADVTYRLIEQPIRERRPLWFRSTVHTNLFGAATSTTLTVLAGIGLALSNHEAKAPRFAQIMIAKAKIETSYENCFKFFWYSVPQPLPIRECTFGNQPLDKPKLMLWGDSHAMALAPVVDILSRAMNVPFLLRVRAACPPLTDVISFDELGRENSDCGALAQAIFDQLSAMPAADRPSGVFMVSRWPLYLGDEIGKPHPKFTSLEIQHGNKLDREEALNLIEKRIETTASQLGKLGIRLLIASPLPAMPHSVPECLARHTAEFCGTARSDFSSYSSDIDTVLDRVKARHPNVRVWDPTDAICDANACSPIKSGVVLYGDSNHLTQAGALLLGNSLRSSLAWLTDSQVAAQ